MTKIVSIFILLSFFFNGFSQRLSTVFVDKILIVVDGDTIVNTLVKKRYYLTTDESHNLTLFKNNAFKLNLYLEKAETKKDPWLLHGNIKLNKNDTALGLVTVCNDCDGIENCCLMSKTHSTIRNWYDSIPKKPTIAKVTYRLFNMAPVDTANYAFHSREGKWIGEDNGNTYYVNYTNDVKNGEAKITFNDGTFFSNTFDMGEPTSGISSFFPSKKSKFKSKAFPGILSSSCFAIIRP